MVVGTNQPFAVSVLWMGVGWGGWRDRMAAKCCMGYAKGKELAAVKYCRDRLSMSSVQV